MDDWRNPDPPVRWPQAQLLGGRKIVGSWDLDDVEQAAHLVDDRLLVSVAERTD
jgi:hypothetical protein